MAAKVVSNLEQLAEAIGSYIGLMEGLETKTYMDTLITKAYARTALEFNKHAAAQAISSRGLEHMWEYGTAGISERGVIKYGNPLSQSARLWKNTLIGKGGVKTISFVILPAKSLVPPHDLEEIEVAREDMPPLKVETGLRKYKFPNKAAIYESGVNVSLAPRQATMLFIPIKTEGMPTKYAGDPKKGFVWTQAHTYSPGLMSDTKGRFTGLFGGWWAGIGAELMSSRMRLEVEKDLVEATTGIRPARKITSAQATSIAAAVERGRKKTRKQWTLRVAHEANGETEVIA